MHKIQALLIGSPVASFIFLATVATSIAVFQNKNLFERLELRPYAFVHRQKRYTIITSGLIHANWQHLIINMLTFYFCAFLVEREFVYQQVVWTDTSDSTAQNLGEFLGRAKFFVLYFGCMIIADLSTIVKYKNVPSYRSVGASGALSGVVIAFIIMEPQIMIFGFLPGWVFAVVYILSSYISAKTQPMSGIAHEAHLWGTIGGAILTPVFYPDAAWRFVESVASWTGAILGTGG